MILPSDFDANGVLRIRKVNGTDIVERLIKSGTGYKGIPYYGLSDFITFNSAPQNTTNTNTSTGVTYISAPTPVYFPVSGG